MIGKKAQQSKPSPWASAPSSTPHRTFSGPAHSHQSAIAAPLSPVTADSFVSAATSPTDSRATSRRKSGRSVASADLDVIPSRATTPDVFAKDKGISVDKAEANDGTDNAEAGHEDPVLPITPKSPDPRSPATLITSIPNETASFAPRSAAVSQDMEVVDELLGTMKQMLSTLGCTFDTLGEQTMKVATLPAAIDAVHQISSVRRQLDDQHKRQEQRMQDVKNLLLEEVRTRLYGRLKTTASSIIKEIVQKEVAERVRQQLHEQIPQQLREEVIQYKRQIMEVRISLHNSEARRHNALIRSNSLDEPLRPLLRPPPVPRPDWPLSVSIPPATAELGAASAYTDKAPTILPITARVFSESDVMKPRMGGNARGRARLPPLEIEPPTPSPLFPRDLTTLIRLGPDEAKALVRDYGLVRVRYPSDPITAKQDEDGNANGDLNEQHPAPGFEDIVEEEPTIEEESREEALNRFLSYIGVGFQLVPTSPTHAKAGITSLTRAA